jgi:hypothetical protein
VSDELRLCPDVQEKSFDDAHKTLLPFLYSSATAEGLFTKVAIFIAWCNDRNIKATPTALALYTRACQETHDNNMRIIGSLRS